MGHPFVAWWNVCGELLRLASAAWGGDAVDAGEAAEEGCAGELVIAGPLGKVKGLGGVRVDGVDPVVVVTDELALDDGAHGLALGGGGALPVEAEALLTDGALDVLLLFGTLEEYLHGRGVLPYVLIRKL